MTTKCKLCGKEVSRSQLNLGDAYKLPDGAYHIECLDDQVREHDDAYYRDENGRRVNQNQR